MTRFVATRQERGPEGQSQAKPTMVAESRSIYQRRNIPSENLRLPVAKGPENLDFKSYLTALAGISDKGYVCESHFAHYQTVKMNYTLHINMAVYHIKSKYIK